MSANPLENATKAFWVYALYSTDPEIQTRRSAVRAEHMAHMGSLYEAKLIRIGGVLFEPEPKDADSPTAAGSAMVVKLGSVAEVRKILEEDIYWTSNVWDKEKLLIFRIYISSLSIDGL
ncbi:hypothetical protein CPB84DRAFT_708880 [Gymnopilus junonius]|uniref:YCII-related domain-containing protein n=1 Tax=Gymnopilus junonius TaxID=109634 RepID=A0A9P5NRD2_GYMJU|nr:hypothetical protein CPB84DRAFT_708880 [Gymnopilus junonius]